MPTERTHSERARLPPSLVLAAGVLALPACSADFSGWELFAPGPADASFDVSREAHEDRADAYGGSREAAADGGANAPDALVQDGTSDDGVAAPDASDARPDVVAMDSAIDAGVDAGRDTGVVDSRDTGVVDPGAPLDGQRWDLPCGRTLQSGLLCENTSPLGAECPGSSVPIRRTVTFGGTSGTFYRVTLRVRGVVEPKSYQNGTSSGGRIYVGGRPTSSVHNVYGFAVSSPPQVYYVNADDGEGEPSRVVKLDATTTVTIEGGATVELFVADSDCAMVRNCLDPRSNVCAPLVVPGVPPAPAPYDGQFVQVNVVSVAP